MREPFDTNEPLSGRPLKVTLTHVVPNVILCTVVGEIDLLTIPGLRVILADASTIPSSHLIIDLSAVEFLSATGLSILMEIRPEQQATSHHLALVVKNNRRVTRALQITGLDKVLGIHSQLAPAVQACRTLEHTQRGKTA